MTYGTAKRNEIKNRIAHFEGKKSKQDLVGEFRDFKRSISTFNPYGTQSLRLIVHNPEDSFETALRTLPTTIFTRRW